MDYVLLGALAPITLLAIFISYDIACQFKLKFRDRMAELPKDIHIPDSVSVDWGIPKCHCPMHKVPCQAPHSLNLKPGVGRTDGEGIERSWAEMNLVENSTKEMGPGSRHDTLDDHFGHHNWRKKVRLGTFPHVLSLLFSLTNFLVRCKFAHAVTLGDTRAETATENFRRFLCVPPRSGIRAEMDEDGGGVGKGRIKAKPLPVRRCQ